MKASAAWSPFSRLIYSKRSMIVAQADSMSDRAASFTVFSPV
jgi:hypothetical protein